MNLWCICAINCGSQIKQELLFIFNCVSLFLSLLLQHNNMHLVANRFSNIRINPKMISQFATAQRSYYEILEIQPSFTQKQLRRKYLDKARKYHPDHNKAPEAVEEFKLLKQAYQTLKDPQKKHMYDSGVSQTPQDVAPVHNHEVKVGRKYYENKWYGYSKPKTTDTRDDYYQTKAEYFAEKPPSPWRHIISFTFIVVAIFGYDMFASFDRKKEQQQSKVKRVLQSSVIDEQKLTKKQKMLRNYMQQRAEQHKVE